MNQNFSVETFIKEYHSKKIESEIINKNAVISTSDMNFKDYVEFLKPPEDIEQVKKYILSHPTVELREIIAVHEPINCKNLLNTGIVDSVEKSLGKDFDFHLLNFHFDIRKKNNLKLKSVSVNAKFNEMFAPNLRPRIVSYFPTADMFCNSNKVSGKVMVSGGNGFQFIDEKEYNEKKHKTSEIDFIYDYSASRKSIFAAQTANGFFFKFFTDETENSTQTFSIRTILLRPRNVKKILMNANFIINEFPVEYNYISEIPVEESNL